MSRQPVVYLPHGGGPWPFVEMGLDRRECELLAGYLRDVAKVPFESPRALLVVSSHWEAAVPTVSSSRAPPMLYDDYGFPPESYTVQWPGLRAPTSGSTPGAAR